MGEIITAEQIRSDLKTMKNTGGATVIRTYGTALGQELIPGIANEMNLKVWPGAWISDDDLNNVAEVNRACDIANDGVVIIGNEYVLSKPDIDKPAAIAKLQNLWTQAKARGRPYQSQQQYQRL